MAKKTAKKTAPKKTAAPRSGRKKTGAVKKAGVKKSSVKKVKTEKEVQTRQANAIANSEKKKTARGSKAKRVKNATVDQTGNLLDAIVEGMQEKKARNIVVIDLSAIENRVSDFFVVCDAESRTQVEAIAGSVEEIAKKLTGESPFHAEGYDNAEWIIIDYINVVAHVFQKETRHYYNIEGLWADAEFKEIN